MDTTDTTDRMGALAAMPTDAWTLRFERTFAHPIESVWRCLEESREHRDAWFPQRIVGDAGARGRAAVRRRPEHPGRGLRRPVPRARATAPARARVGRRSAAHRAHGRRRPDADGVPRHDRRSPARGPHRFGLAPLPRSHGCAPRRHAGAGDHRAGVGRAPRSLPRRCSAASATSGAPPPPEPRRGRQGAARTASMPGVSIEKWARTGRPSRRVHRWTSAMSNGAPVATTVPRVCPIWITSPSASKIASMVTAEAMAPGQGQTERGEAVVALEPPAPRQSFVLRDDDLRVEQLEQGVEVLGGHGRVHGLDGLDVGHGYQPLKLGGRRSAKACDALGHVGGGRHELLGVGLLLEGAVARALVAAVHEPLRHARWPWWGRTRGGWRARRPSAASSAAGTTRLAMPQRSQSAADRSSPRNISSLARCGPTMRGSR